MRIAQLSPLHEAVPPRRYGGTERVVSWLTEELVRRGHDVTLFASGDSRTKAHLVSVVPHALRPSGAVDCVAPHVLEIGMLRDQLRRFDVVHSHLDYFPFPILRPSDPPLITTLHGRLDLREIAPVFRFFRDQPLISVSDGQRGPLPNQRWVATVHHGLPLEDYPPGHGSGDYFVFLGRMSPEKRPHVAIDVARRAGVRLVVAAKVSRADRAYFDEVVVPRLQTPGVEFVGETDAPATIRLLQEAKGLLFPILWPEPFGLAMIEAMACGTPVITRRCGSTPEVVAHGKTGFVCDDDEALVQAVSQIDRIDRAACRRWVERQFSVERMASEYEAVYRGLVEARGRAWKTSSGFTIAITSSRPRGSRTTALES